MDKLLTNSSVEVSDSDMQNATLMNEVTPDYSPPLDVLKHHIVQQLKSMINLVTLSTNVDVLKTVEKNLNTAKCTLAVMQNEEAVLIPKYSVPDTKMVEKQHSFCTKTKNRSCKIKFGILYACMYIPTASCSIPSKATFILLCWPKEGFHCLWHLLHL